MLWRKKFEFFFVLSFVKFVGGFYSIIYACLLMCLSELQILVVIDYGFFFTLLSLYCCTSMLKAFAKVECILKCQSGAPYLKLIEQLLYFRHNQYEQYFFCFLFKKKTKGPNGPIQDPTKKKNQTEINWFGF